MIYLIFLFLCGLLPIPPSPTPLQSVPPIQEMCLSVTSYWVWDEQGDMFPGWRGQCNEDCSIVASGHSLPIKAEDYGGGYAACIQEWTKLKGIPTKTVTFDGKTVYCVDNFGDPDYWAPFYHEGYEKWVIPIDILTEFEHGLQCDWSISRGFPPEF